jgi:lipoprotein-anchoring transpeptidase ErfK/SrfK
VHECVPFLSVKSLSDWKASERAAIDPGPTRFATGSPESARKYPVGVGRSGKQWFGTTRIASKHVKPAWKPPVSLRGKRSPDFYVESGSPKNPMGAAALVLADSELAIHGTNNPASIGGFVSAGCIRMHNKDIMDLYGRVNVGTRVVFVK